MIRIQVEKAIVSSSSGLNNFEKVLHAQAGNAAAEGWADELKKSGIEKRTCDKHPNHTSTIVIKATGTKELLRAEKRGFCCSDFDKSIVINIKR